MPVFRRPGFEDAAAAIPPDAEKEPAAGPQDAQCLAKDGLLVAEEHDAELAHDVVEQPVREGQR